MNIVILPAGAWGTALALHLLKQKHTVTLLPRSADNAMEMGTLRENKQYFPGRNLPQDLQIGLELRPALMEADVCILACPSRYLRSVCREISGQLDLATQLKVFISLCKGMEESSNALPLQVMEEELPGYEHAVLSGPTFATQVADGQPSALVLAGKKVSPALRALQEAISGDVLRVYTSDDAVGVELGGCLKNVYAIAAGICDGLGLRDNSKAALLTRALHEMVRVGTGLGGRAETFYGLTGFGDLVLTCNGDESRNRTFGHLFAEGISIEELIEKRKMTVEGYRTALCFYNICAEKNIEAPILKQIHQILYKGQSAREAIHALMSRELKEEQQ